MVDPVRGTQYAQYQFAWSDITAILSNGEPLSIIISGHTIHAESTATELASCLNNALQLTCSGTTFVRTSFLTGIYVESVPSVAPTAEVSTVQAKAPNNNRAYLIVGYVVAGLAGLWLLYILRRWCQYKLDGVQSDANRTLYVESIADKPKPRYPIFAYIVSLFVVVKAVEVDFIAVENNTTIPVPATTYNGIGANIEGHTELPDLEANLPSQETENTIYTEQKQQRVVVPALLESVRKGDSSDLNSFKSSSEFDVDVVLSEESSYIASEYGRSELENTAEGDSFGGLGELPSSDSESEGTQYSS
eukprot:gene11826-13723_t